uniref:Muscarinic acetylcholine receptor n=1 Tax=Periophthalmus magnuspinnatus TaxID=409849 RepID=A0A3B3ZWN3_9GOBI
MSSAKWALTALVVRVEHLTDGLMVTDILDPLGGHQLWQVVLIVLVTGMLSLVTIIGNILVVVSFKVNRQLKTVNNYFLLSLAVADLIIGVISMNVYTAFLVMGYWAMGNWACDLWLAIDYVASNASVMNLLVISFDRYFSITRPLTYRAKRTTKRAGIMIGLAWFVSLVLWAPAILLWQFFEGERTVPSHECYIQFLSEPTITFCTAMAAFYLPVTIMRSVGRGAIGPKRGNGTGEKAHFVHQTGRSWLVAYIVGLEFDPGNLVVSDMERGTRTRAAVTVGTTMMLPCPWTSLARQRRRTVEGRRCFPRVTPFSPLSLIQSMPSIQANANTSLLDGQATTASDSSTTSMTTKSPSVPISFKEAALAKRFAARARNQITKRKRMSLVKEKKAAQTLSAILFAFIITWTPYNIMVLINAFCKDCIPAVLWAVGYWLCYVNSTVNPMCYALCNKTFRTTFKMILLYNILSTKTQGPVNQRALCSSVPMM